MYLDVKQDKATNPELSRREKLLKWREERKQKKGTEPQKKSFVVRHVKYEQEALLFANAMKKATKGVTPLIKPSQYEASKPAKRVTRASVRIAKQSANLATDFKTRGVKKVESKPKPACSDKLKEKNDKLKEKKVSYEILCCILIKKKSLDFVYHNKDGEIQLCHKTCKK